MVVCPWFCLGSPHPPPPPTQGNDGDEVEHMASAMATATMTMTRARGVRASTVRTGDHPIERWWSAQGLARRKEGSVGNLSSLASYCSISIYL